MTDSKKYFYSVDKKDILEQNKKLGGYISLNEFRSKYYFFSYKPNLWYKWMSHYYRYRAEKYRQIKSVNIHVFVAGGELVDERVGKIVKRVLKEKQK